MEGGARALLSGDERLGRGGARALRGVRGLRGAAAAFWGSAAPPRLRLRTESA